MNVQQLREALEDWPDHLEVILEVDCQMNEDDHIGHSIEILDDGQHGSAHFLRLVG